jgi:hypothetical protein
MNANFGGKTMWRVLGTAAAVVLAGIATFAQVDPRLEAPDPVDLSGNWVSRAGTESLGQLRPYDFLGIPLNDAAKHWALSHDEAQLSEPERQCDYYTTTYFPFGFAPLPMWRETEYRTGSTVAWMIGGWLDVVPTVIWMDGRPHPSKYAPHNKTGFTTGVWKDDVLTTTTTHMEANLLHRRAPHSDQIKMLMRFSKHGDILTLTARIEDPVYLAEPLYVTREFQHQSAPQNRSAVPCTVAYEGVPPGKVVGYLPGQNPFINEVTERWGIPLEAVVGGPETMYPEFRKKIKDQYKRPPVCPTNPTEQRSGQCGGPGRSAPVL